MLTKTEQAPPLSAATVPASTDVVEGICNVLADGAMHLAEHIAFAANAAKKSGWPPPTLEAKRTANRLFGYAMYRIGYEEPTKPESLEFDVFAEPCGGLILALDYQEKRLTVRISSDGGPASISEVDAEGFQGRSMVEREQDLNPLVRWLVRTV